MTPAPLSAFNFAVEITVPGLSPHVCGGGFQECDGLELTMEPKVLREGGNNGTVHRLTGPAGYGQVTLKRGVTSTLDLWTWFDRTIAEPGLRGDGEIVLLAPDRSERLRFVLTRCLPVKLKAPALNARDGAIAIEELGLVFEQLAVRPGAALSASIGVDVSAGVSFGA
jgi:phage tail-like protein